MDLRKYNVTPEQLTILKSRIGYQPFILNEDICLGVADMWSNGGEIKQAERARIPEDAFDRFQCATLSMIRMYGDWVLAVRDALGGLDGLSVTDTACNSGHFLYRFLEEGAASATGYDMDPKFDKVFNALNEITGFDARFLNVAYDMMTHVIPGAEESDIVVSTAIMCHLSDPVYYMNFLGSITRKALLLFSTIDDSDKMRITYNEPRKYYNTSFPVCFDNMTTVSKPLVLFSLKEVGFREIVEIPYNDAWLSHKWYKPFKCFVALK